MQFSESLKKNEQFRFVYKNGRSYANICLIAIFFIFLHIIIYKHLKTMEIKEGYMPFMGLDKWDRFILDEYIEPMMYYNLNDVFIVAEIKVLKGLLV